ncbi:MAG: hypothetical protein ACUVS2_01855 [Candidatus Flexifilum sp.]|jgi:hypothetical protein
MRGRVTLIVLGAIFIVLVALTLLQSGQPPARQRPTPRPLYLVYDDLPVLDMLAIRLRVPDGDAGLTLTRADDGTWMRPDGGWIDADTATAIARTIALLPYLRTIEPESDDLSAFGFLPRGIFSIEVVLVDGSARAIEIGDLARSNDGYFAVVDDRREIYLLQRAAVDFLIQQYQRRDDPPPTATP